MSKLSQEKDLVELRLRCYETESNQLAPTLEETQWEVGHESYLLYDIGFECMYNLFEVSEHKVLPKEEDSLQFI